MAAQASIVETSGGITGAGAGGGLGLNAPGAGPKIQHFGGQGTGVKVKGLTIPGDLGDIWQKIIGDDDPTTWMVCEYSSDGKALEVKAGTSLVVILLAALQTMWVLGSARILFLAKPCYRT